MRLGGQTRCVGCNRETRSAYYGGDRKVAVCQDCLKILEEKPETKDLLLLVLGERLLVGREPRSGAGSE